MHKLLLFLLFLLPIQSYAQVTFPNSDAIELSELTLCNGSYRSIDCVEVVLNDDSRSGLMASVVEGAAIENCPASKYFGANYSVPVNNPSAPRVTTPAALLAEIATWSGGGNVVYVQDGNRGSGWDITIPASASGTVNNPNFILSETIWGAEFANGAKWTIDNVDHLVVAGFERSGGAGFQPVGGSTFIRWACNKNDHGGASTYENFLMGDASANPPYVYDIEIDNNLDNNMGALWYRNPQCSYFNYPGGGSACTGTNQRHYLHDNEFYDRDSGIPQQASSATLEYAFYTGIGWSHSDNLQRYPDPNKHATEQKIIFENNTFRWRAPRFGATDIKSSGNIFRFNCSIDAGDPYRVRQGDDNLAYGNWIMGGGIKNDSSNGRGNIKAFNYYAQGNNSNPAILIIKTLAESSGFYAGYVLAYEGNDNVWAYNVYNRYNKFIQWAGLSGAWSEPFGSLPTDTTERNEIVGNKIYTSQSVTHYEVILPSGNDINETQFQTLNPLWNKTSNIVDTTERDASVACFTPGVVNGVQSNYTTHQYINGGAQTLTPPSWW